MKRIVLAITLVAATAACTGATPTDVSPSFDNAMGSGMGRTQPDDGSGGTGVGTSTEDGGYMGSGGGRTGG